MPARIRIVLLLIALLTSGCDFPDAVQSADCNTSLEEPKTPSKKAYEDVCVLGHRNTQSADRKW